MSQRILIVGAGFAGVWAALSAAKSLDLTPGSLQPIEVVVIAPEPELVIRPRLYEENPGGMAAPLTELYAEMGIQFIRGTVEAIRVGEHEVDVNSAEGCMRTVAYDRLVLAAGSALHRPDIVGLSEHAFSVDQKAEAVALEAHLQLLADQPDSPTRNTVVVAGGGFTGLEIATELPGRLRRILGEKTDVRIVIVERAEDIGPELGAGPRPLIETALADLGIATRLGSPVAHVHPDGITTSSGDRIHASTVIWTGGMRATPLTAYIPGERDELGRLRVDRNLRVSTSPDVFATGDAAVAATDDVGNETLMCCQHASLLGRQAGANAAMDLLGNELAQFSQPEYFTCLDLGAWGAVLTMGWDRKVDSSGARIKELKRQINGVWLYPPTDREGALAALAAVDPAQDLADAMASVSQAAQLHGAKN